MAQLVRDSIFGQFLHFVSDGKLLQYQEQSNPSLWHSRALDEKIACRPSHKNLDRSGEHPNPGGAVARNRQEGDMNLASSADSSRSTVVPDDDASEASTNRSNAEKGKDPNLVDWYGPHDPEVSW